MDNKTTKEHTYIHSIYYTYNKGLDKKTYSIIEVTKLGSKRTFKAFFTQSII